MKLPRRNFLHLAVGAAALPTASRIAFAQDYPTRPVRILVGFAPGGGVDIKARLIGQWLSERLGQPFVIENRPVAGTNITTQGVVSAPPPYSGNFIINGARFTARTPACFGWAAGERITLIAGDWNGRCVVAAFYNFYRRNTCEMWCVGGWW
jgi:hypothetical protein